MTSDPTTGCPSRLLRVELKDQVDRRGGGEGGGKGWLVVTNGGELVRRGRRRRRNVHESFRFYCTFSIILRNSGEKSRKMYRVTELLTVREQTGTVGTLLVFRFLNNKTKKTPCKPTFSFFICKSCWLRAWGRVT